jgi:hypothetical protein
MAFSPGTRLGPYEITAQIGVGGPAFVRARGRRANFGASAEALRMP